MTEQERGGSTDLLEENKNLQERIPELEETQKPTHVLVPQDDDQERGLSGRAFGIIVFLTVLLSIFMYALFLSASG